MKTDLVRIHHAEYLDDIPFWISATEKMDRVLEVGCGHGRVSIPLLIAGHHIVGVDIEPEAVDYLNNYLKTELGEISNRAEIILVDIVDYHPAQNFDAVIIPCNTYSTFPGEKRRLMLSSIYRMLTPGGIMAASMPNPYRVQQFHLELAESQEVAGPDVETTFSHPNSGHPVQVSSRLTSREESLGWEWIYDHLFPDGQVERMVQSTEHYLASLEIYLDELAAAGFGGVDSLGDHDRSPFRNDSPFLILVGRK